MAEALNDAYSTAFITECSLQQQANKKAFHAGGHLLIC